MSQEKSPLRASGKKALLGLFRTAVIYGCLITGWNAVKDDVVSELSLSTPNSDKKTNTLLQTDSPKEHLQTSYDDKLTITPEPK